MRFSEDGLMVSFSVEQGKEVVQHMREKHGWKYGNGECGRGLYSSNWDRQMGEWADRKVEGGRRYEKCFWANPSVMHYLPDHLKALD